MNFRKNKLLILSPLIVLIVVFIFSLTMIPAINPAPKKLPIAIVNEDQGVNMGKAIVEKIQKMSISKDGKEPQLKFILVASAIQVKEGLNNQEYYAALVIPKDYSSKQASLRTPDPIPPQIEILVNQGQSVMASNMASQMLNGIVDNLNNSIRTQLLDGFDKTGEKLTTKQARVLANPITKKVTLFNEIGTHSSSGNSPVSLFQPLWVASLAGAATIYLSTKKIKFKNKKEKLIGKLVQLSFGVVIALIAGFGLTLISSGLLGLHIPRVTDTALFLSLTCLSFFIMILAVISWIGLGGMSIFALIMFFGIPMLTMPPEFMPTFYHKFVYPWLPMRFMVSGLRELLFFNKTGDITVLVGIGLISLLVLLSSTLKSNKTN